MLSQATRQGLAWSMAAVLLSPVGGVEAQTLSGTVVESTGAAVGAVTVTLRSRDGDVVGEAQSAADGSYQLRIPAAGEYRLHAGGGGYRVTESPLFELAADRVYVFDLEVTPSPPASMSAAPAGRAAYLDWVRSRVDAWQTRDITIVEGQEWREAAAGRDLLGALEAAGLPGVRWERQGDRLCGRTRATTQCLRPLLLNHGATPRVLDVAADQVDAIVLVGPRIYSAPTPGAMGWEERVEQGGVFVFMNGYLLIEPVPR